MAPARVGGMIYMVPAGACELRHQTLILCVGFQLRVILRQSVYIGRIGFVCLFLSFYSAGGAHCNDVCKSLCLIFGVRLYNCRKVRNKVVAALQLVFYLCPATVNVLVHRLQVIVASDEEGNHRNDNSKRYYYYG